MQIDIDKLAANGLKLNLDRADGLRRRLELAPSQGISGSYVSDREHIRITARVSSALALAALEWAFDGLRVDSVAGAAIEEAGIDLDIPRGDRGPTTGSITAKRLRLDRLAVHIDSLNQPVRLEGVDIEGVTIALGAGGTKICATRVNVEVLTLLLGALELSAHGLAVGDLEVQGQDVAAGVVVAGQVKVRHPDVRSWFERKEGDVPKQEREAPDLSLLDRLSGCLNVDLRVDTTLPILGRHKATHCFRIPIADGTIDFKGVERNLAVLEDAVLDFVVKEGELRLVRDIPLIPFDEKTLISWPLPPDEHGLASQNRVRLRRLVGYTIPVSATKKAEDEKSSVQVRAVHLDNLLLEVSLGGPVAYAALDGQLRLGTTERPAIGALSMTGKVHYDARSEPAQTSLDLAADNCAIGLDGLRVGRRRLDAQELLVSRLGDVRLVFRGVQPGELTAACDQLVLRGLKLAAEAPAPSPCSG